jgi:hypothetical protein
VPVGADDDGYLLDNRQSQAGARFEALANLVDCRAGAVSHAGIATAAEVDQHLDNIAAGRLPDLATSPMVSAWGRKP